MSTYIRAMVLKILNFSISPPERRRNYNAHSLNEEGSDKRKAGV